MIESEMATRTRLANKRTEELKTFGMDVIASFGSSGYHLEDESANDDARSNGDSVDQSSYYGCDVHSNFSFG